MNAIIGRRNLLNEGLIEQIAAEVKRGRALPDAAFLCGVNPKTFENWMMGARMIAEGNLKHPRVPTPDQHDLYLKLYMAVMTARVGPRALALDVLIAKVDVEDPKTGSMYAALEILDRLGDGQYSKTQKYESHHTEEKVEYHVDVNELGNADEIAAILAGTGADASEIGFFEPGTGADALPAFGSGETVYTVHANDETGSLSTPE